MFEILIDTSNTELNVGLAKDKVLIDKISYQAWQRQSELLVVEINNLLEKHNIDRKEIDAVAVGIGPGSYTGVRIGLTVAKTMAYAIKCDLYASSSLYLLKGDKPSICVMNARSGRSYFAVYNGEEAIEPDQILDNDQVKEYIANHSDYLVCGDTLHLGIKSDAYSIIDNLLGSLTPNHKIDSVFKINPIYLKDLYR